MRYEDVIRPTVNTLIEGKSVVVDGLFARSVNRKEILDAVRDIPCTKILIVLDTPLEDCIQRNANRSYPLPEFMIRDIHGSFETPSLNEGWDEILHCNNE